MTYSSPATGLPTPQTISSMTPDHLAACLVSGGSGISQTWPTANQAYFFPVVLDRPALYVRAWWLNGVTLGANVDVAIYTISGTTATRVGGTGATAMAGASSMQTVTVSIAAGPGLYYLAMGCSLATATPWRTSSATNILRPMGVFQLATPANPIPSTATVAAIATGASAVFGFSELTTI